MSHSAATMCKSGVKVCCFRDEGNAILLMWALRLKEIGRCNLKLRESFKFVMRLTGHAHIGGTCAQIPLTFGISYTQASGQKCVVPHSPNPFVHTFIHSMVLKTSCTIRL